MGAPQFAQQVDNTTTNNAVSTTVTANTANQLDDDELAADLSSSNYETGEKNISGAKELVVAADESSGSTSTVVVEWTNGAGDVIYAETPSALDGLTNSKDYARLVVKSTHVQVTASGSSTNYNMTVNAH